MSRTQRPYSGTVRGGSKKLAISLLCPTDRRGSSTVFSAANFYRRFLLLSHQITHIFSRSSSSELQTKKKQINTEKYEYAVDYSQTNTSNESDYL